MKLFFAALLSLAFLSIAKAQVVPSSCVAHDSIIKKYSGSAEKLAVNRVTFKINSNYTDSVNIDPVLRHHYLRCLLAVFNATALPARDTVVKLKIEKLTYTTNTLTINADSNFTWMKNIRDNIIPTGNNTVDSLISRYGLQKNSYFMPYNSSYHVAGFTTDSILNMFALGKKFNTLLGTFGSGPEIFCCSPFEIRDSINNDFTELTYTYGWGDCISGCMHRRHWKFRIYNDCSVEYKGSYGSPYVGLTENNFKLAWKLFPNPAKDALNIVLQTNAFQAIRAYIYTATGQLVSEQIIIPDGDAGIICTKNLSAGVYVLKIVSTDKDQKLISNKRFIVAP